jgi:hypothetical protein
MIEIDDISASAKMRRSSAKHRWVNFNLEQRKWNLKPEPAEVYSFKI